jgi:prophage regulatory protein
MKPPKFLRLPEVMSRTGLSRSSVYVAIKAQKLAPPVKIGARSIAFLESDIEQFISDCIAGRQAQQA